MIFHAKKTGCFVMVDKAAINDPRLSLKAKGLLCYLLSKPPDWRPQIEDICNHCSDGPRAVRSALKELASFGYAKLIKQQGDSGQWEGSFWTITEKPESTEIAVSRMSENRNLKLPRMIKSTKNERILRDCPPSPIEGWNAPEPEALKSENLKLLTELLIGHIEERFISQWERRIELSPWRAQLALADLANEVAAEQSEFGRAFGVKIKNRGGRANWFYLNCDKPRKGKHGGIHQPAN